MRPSHRPVWILPGVLFVAFAGVLSLPIPFGGDQALFTVGARMMSEGAALYRDFWDFKPPALFAFYYVGGRLFGFHEVGIHTLELLYFIGFGATLSLALAGRYENDATSTIVPFLTVGLYFAVAESWHLTQVEGLVGFPLFASLWLFVRGVESVGSRRANFFLSGFCGGLVLLFKPLFLPILAVMWAAVWIGPPKRIPKLHLPAAGFLSLGLMTPLVGAFVYFALEGTVSEAYRTLFEIPLRMSRTYYVLDFTVLARGVGWFLTWSSPLLALGTIGVASGRVFRDPIARGALAWFAASVLVIALQRGWTYQFVLLLWPLGLIAATGVDRLLTRVEPDWMGKSVPARVAGAVAVLAMLFAPATLTLANKGRHILPLIRRLNTQGLRDYQSRLSPSYGAVLAEVAWLPPAGKSASALYVLGDPLYLYLSHRVQPVAINGWSLEFLLAEQWSELYRSLVEAEPEFVFLQDYNLELIQERYPQVLSWLDERYQVIRRSERGSWYERRAR